MAKSRGVCDGKGKSSLGVYSVEGMPHWYTCLIAGQEKVLGAAVYALTVAPCSRQNLDPTGPTLKATRTIKKGEYIDYIGGKVTDTLSVVSSSTLRSDLTSPYGSAALQSSFTHPLPRRAWYRDGIIVELWSSCASPLYFIDHACGEVLSPLRPQPSTLGCAKHGAKAKPAVECKGSWPGSPINVDIKFFHTGS